jgi:YD repeat-containing protein
MNVKPESNSRTDQWSVAPDHRSGRQRCALAVLLLISGASFAAESPKTPAPAKPFSRWVEIEAATGAMALDGTLRLNFSLGDAPELKALGLVFELRHNVETDAYGRARSAWQVRGLESSLVPVGRAQLRWRTFSGEPIEFERAKIGRAFAGAGSSRWLIREIGHAGHEIRAADGRTWRFRAGLPVGVDDPALGSFSFTTQGASRREIRRTDALADAAPLLCADYDPAGRLLALTVGTSAEQRFERDTSGQLVAWQRADGRTVRFAYREGLLVAVAEPDRSVRNFAWAENPGHLRGDSRWAAPVHLVADGATAYDYTLSAAGFALRRRHAGEGGAEVVTIFNPRRHRVEQRVGNKTVVATFRGGGTGRGALENITTGAGEVLEAYHYDGRGQLVRVSRAGEPERILTYDESGRVVTMEEKF